MSDLEIAKKEMVEKDQTLVIVKSGKVIFMARELGLIAFLEAIDKFGDDLNGSSVADNIIGKAAAMLCKYSKISEAYGETMSESGLEVLKKSGIGAEYGKLVPMILNRRQDGACIFEKATIDCENEVECYQAIKDFWEKISKNKK